MLPLDHYRKMEAQSHRASAWSTSSDLPHPDECPKLVIHGVAWSVPSRSAAIVPTVKDGSVSLEITSEDQWSAADALIEDAPILGADPCPDCGQDRRAYLDVLRGNEKHMEWLRQLMELVCNLLDVYYALGPEQKQGLLSFPLGHTPEWPSQVLDWCRSDEIMAVK